MKESQHAPVHSCFQAFMIWLDYDKVLAVCVLMGLMSFFVLLSTILAAPLVKHHLEHRNAMQHGYEQVREDGVTLWKPAGMKAARTFIDALGYTIAFEQYLDGAPLPPPIDSEPRQLDIPWVVVSSTGAIHSYETKRAAYESLKDHPNATHIFHASESITVLR